MTIDFLGKGPSFPFRLDETGTRPSFSQDEDIVFESIESILNTNIGERPHRVKNGVPYGTTFRNLLFNNVEGAIDTAKFQAKRALSTWEPRISVIDVSVERYRDRASGLVGIVVNVLFAYRATNRVDNYVTFYRTKVEDEVV